MLNVHGEVVESGVDWITVTASGSVQGDLLRHRAQSIFQTEIEAGNECRPWGHKGYEGFTVGHAELGTRLDSTIVRLHGVLARESWWDVFEVATNCSRLDLQVTVRVAGSQPCRMVNRCLTVARHHKLHGKAQTWHLRRDSNRGDTVEFGRRVSDLFLRCYCKECESGLDYYKGCFRCEAELKRFVARSVATSLSDGRSVFEGSQGILHQIAKTRGIVLPTFEAGQTTSCLPNRGGDRQKWLAWLQKCVRPHVQREISRGGLNDVLTALGLDSLK